LISVTRDEHGNEKIGIKVAEIREFFFFYIVPTMYQITAHLQMREIKKKLLLKYYDTAPLPDLFY
jgi:hypothetical protein